MRRTRCSSAPLGIALLVVLGDVAGSPTSADVPVGRTSFASANGRFELRLTTRLGSDPQIWTLVDRRTGATRYSVRASFAGRDVRLSDDGRHLCAIDAFLDGEPELGRRVLEFFRDGEPVRSYALGDLVPDLHHVARSTSHWLWRAEDQPGWPSTRAAGPASTDTIVFTTLDLRVHAFDVASGERISVACSPIVPPGATAIAASVRLVTPAIPGVTPRRFAVVSGCGLCGQRAPDVGMTFEIPADFDPGARFGWLVDEALLPAARNHGWFILKDGHVVDVLPTFAWPCP